MLNKGLFKKKFGVKGHFCTSSTLVYANEVYEYEQLKLVEYQMFRYYFWKMYVSYCLTSEMFIKPIHFP